MCHQDAHNRQFESKPHNNRCEDCHGLDGWKPASYTLANHNETSFTLKGAHAAVPCLDCHAQRGVDTPYHPASANCTDCHQNVHGFPADRRSSDSGVCSVPRK
jgi:hypothetical protein